ATGVSSSGFLIMNLDEPCGYTIEVLSHYFHATNLIVNTPTSSDSKALSPKAVSTSSSILVCRILIAWPKQPQHNTIPIGYTSDVVVEKAHDREHPGKQVARMFSDVSVSGVYTSLPTGKGTLLRPWAVWNTGYTAI
ncbi:hypothetical protein P691DRAFT_784903, partial [Macrolepiota fuliginosa MF-IS2]